MVIPNHVNTNLPPVDINIFIKVDGEFVRATRTSWATNSDTKLSVELSDGTVAEVSREKVEWFYP